MNSYTWSAPLHHFRERISRSSIGSNVASTVPTPNRMSVELTNASIDVVKDPQKTMLPLVEKSSKYVKDREMGSRPCSIVRGVRVRWHRLTPFTRRILQFSLLPIVLCYFSIEIIDALYPKYGIAADVVRSPLPVSNKHEFVVVINSYQRPLLLLDAVHHYAETCGPQIGVKSVYVIWAEEEVMPPDPKQFFAPSDRPTQRSKVFVQPVRNSLNSRFLPIPGVIDMAVFMVDDDIRVDCSSLKLAFSAWNASPSSMVGFYPRLAKWDLSDSGKRYIRAAPERFVYQSWPIVYLRQRMNFILTKACFLHSHYMSVYSDPDQHPVEILNYVDKHFNCEDIAMSLLVANITKPADGIDKQPVRSIYVEGRVSDKGLFNGISTGSGHMAKRSQCLSYLSNVYREKGWGIPLNWEFSLRKSSWRRHIPGFWWQYRPSNIFEWFALSNIFK